MWKERWKATAAARKRVDKWSIYDDEEEKDAGDKNAPSLKEIRRGPRGAPKGMKRD